MTDEFASRGIYGGVAMPERQLCPLCEEPVTEDHDARPIGTEVGQQLAHRECLLRSVMGGIGHLTDHARWCLTAHDPDGGHTYRESALLVDQWVVDHGVDTSRGTR